MNQNRPDIIAGIKEFAIDNEKFEMTLTLTVASENPGIDKYKTVYDDIHNLLATSYQEQTNRKERF
ncbi:hypothetical protein [Oceanobacillus caeni]|uniref:Uncharacterized protein n=1 Tax=Oceanobacillus caeni TaxID=405946 RepID=A0ABR5MK76_9BACI|nr:hypothetical protein [Oceanobacillus caeni]KPH76097.1 hypothetical protein AFL42_07320 [Oceanobacillus caeni]